MSQWEKLVAEILNKGPNLRFDELYKALLKIGYTVDQPKSGSSHYTFRKAGHMPITLPRQVPVKRVYVQLIAEAVKTYLQEEQDG